jgi:hypothetical protein
MNFLSNLGDAFVMDPRGAVNCEVRLLQMSAVLFI